jgi:hypothetical protein
MCKRQIYYITLLIFTIILAFGCTDTDPFSGEGDLSGDCEGAFVNLAFKMPSLPEVELRAQEPSRESEEAVSDLYMLVFDANGNRVNNVSKFYSKEELALTHPFTTGTLNNILLPKGKNTIYLIANAEASYNMDITPSTLDAITTQSQLKELEVRFINIHQAPSNRGVRNNILMWGYTNVTVACGTSTNVQIHLRSIESKVRFRVFIHPDVISSLEVELAEYSVENIPRRGLVVADKPLTFTHATRANDVYRLAPREFDVPEDLSVTRKPPGSNLYAKLVGDFYYYQMENSQVPTKLIDIPAPEGLKLRGKLEKDAEGRNVREIKSEHPAFEYAPEMCTFVRIKARVKSTNPDDAYYADAYYYVPLGHDPNDPNNYNVLGNYAYTYNIYIRGVKDIIIESDVLGCHTDLYEDASLSGEEVNPLTEGFVFYAVKEIIVDSHYANVEMKVSPETISKIKAGTDTISYLVNTPFDNAYMPTGGQVDIYWASFSPMPTNSDRLVPYPGNQANKNSPVPKIKVDELNGMIKSGALDSYIRADGSIKFTAYIDEFFYDAHPVNPAIPISYGDFTNRPMRGMAIFLVSCMSKDHQSRLFRENALQIRQKAIWTIFTRESAKVVSGYGMESIDETYPVSKPSASYGGIVYNDVDKVNGRPNMLNIWAKSKDNTSDFRISFNPDGSGRSLWRNKTVQARSNTENIMRWQPGDPTYGNLVPENWWGDFTSGLYDTGAFACLQRNRDNNGNGIIDEDEIKWYMPSYNQMLNTYIGKATIPETYWFHHLRDRVDLYWSGGNASLERQKESYYQVTTPKLNTPKSIGNYWADEGISLGNYAAYRVRCFRNLPKTIVQGEANEDISGDFGYIARLHKKTDTEPAYIRVSRNMDPTSYRARFVGSGPLPVPHLYRDAANSLTYDFYVAKNNRSTGGSFQARFEDYKKGIDPCDGYTEQGVTGWRTPNQVELALIFLINAGQMGLAADGTPADNYFGSLNGVFSLSIAYDKVRDGTPVPTGTAPYRINNIESASHIRENNWGAVNITRCVKDRHRTD